jgi:uncharacterized protein (TIGR03437 family)
MFVNMRTVAIAAAVTSGLATQSLVAACSTTTIAYKVTGMFGGNVISGPDKFKLAHGPFSVTVYACESLTPVRTGPDWAAYSPLSLTGTVTSGLTGQPTTIGSQRTSIVLVDPGTPSGVDTVQLSAPVPFEGAVIVIHASLAFPAGTLTSTSVAPFPSTSTITSKSIFSYVVTPPAWQASTPYNLGKEILDPSGNIQEVTTAGTSGATSPVWQETPGQTTSDNSVVWTCQGPLMPTILSVVGTASGAVYTGTAVRANVLLHTDGVQVITAHGDGTQSLRPMQEAPVDLGGPSDKVMLRFYASGVQDASEVHVQIAGQDVPVRYSGASGHFAGLDELIVEVPHSLAGTGDVDVVLTVDGQTASPVRIRIQ